MMLLEEYIKNVIGLCQIYNFDLKKLKSLNSKWVNIVFLWVLFYENRNLDLEIKNAKKDISFLKNTNGYLNLSEKDLEWILNNNLFWEFSQGNEKAVDIVKKWDLLSYKAYKSFSEEEQEKVLKSMDLKEVELLLDI